MRESGAPLRERLFTTPVIAAGATTIALGVITAATGGMALAANRDFKRERDRNIDSSLPLDARIAAFDDATSAADRGDRLSLVSDLFLVGTVASAGVTAYFVVKALRGNRQDDSRSESAGIAVIPSVGPTAGGATIQGRF